MNEQLARFKPGDNVPVFAEELLPAGRFVSIVAPAEDVAGDYGKTTQGDYAAKLASANAVRPFGVTERESGPTTDAVTSWTRRVNVVRRGAVARVEASAEIKVGEEVAVAANGKAGKAAEPSEAEVKEGKLTKSPAVGRAVSTAAKDAYVEVELY